MIKPAPRCTFIGEDESGSIMRCARWLHHPDDHYSYQEVIERMCEYIAARSGIDTQDDMNLTRQLVIVKQARAWYDRMVLE